MVNLSFVIDLKKKNLSKEIGDSRGAYRKRDMNTVWIMLENFTNKDNFEEFLREFQDVFMEEFLCIQDCKNNHTIIPYCSKAFFHSYCPFIIVAEKLKN